MPIYPKNKTNMGQTPNVSSGKFARGEPKFLIQHYTAGGSGRDSAKYLFYPHSPGSSAHFVVDRNGDVIQLSDTNRVCWHAGKSLWRGISFLNAHSIGIEIANYGYWRPGLKEVPTLEDAIKKGWVKARHKNGGPELYWEPYPEEQILANLELSAWILKTHPTIREILGHDDIAKGRKSDPGPAFPMERHQVLLNPDSEGSKIPKDLKKETEVVKPKDKFKVNATVLNVRGGPGTNFDTLAWGPLKQGDIVTKLDDRGDWSYINKGDKAGENEGWCYDQYLSHV